HTTHTTHTTQASNTAQTSTPTTLPITTPTTLPTKLPPNVQAQLASELKDIQLPEAVDGWPPAPGWWIVTLLMLFSVAYAIYRLKPRWRRYRQRRYWLQQVHALHQAYSAQPKAAQNAVQTIDQCAALLKRILLTHHTRDSIAKLTGDDWISRLTSETNATANRIFSEISCTLLVQSRFQRDAIPHEHVEQLLTETKNWIHAYTPQTRDMKTTHTATR
ncbi:MAG: DUF4381 domain-containing protein, partial [Gammaproteobacteria bacterium]